MSFNDSISTEYTTGATTVDQVDQHTETKVSTKTSEFFVFLAAVAAVVVTSLMVGQDANTGDDPFSAQDALRYITYLSIGYMVARGLAKAGSRAHDAR